MFRADDYGVAGMTSADMEMEQQRRQWEDDEWNELELRKQQEARRDDKIEVNSCFFVFIDCTSFASDAVLEADCGPVSGMMCGIAVFKQALERIEEETQELRERLSRRKEQKEVQARQQRERLKATFLKKQVAERIKAAAAKLKPGAQGQ